MSNPVAPEGGQDPGANAIPPASSPEDLARLLMAAGSITMPVPDALPSKGSLRRKLLGALLIAAVGVGASVMSCVGQSFSYRQARALEGIEQFLKEIHASCSTRGSVP